MAIHTHEITQDNFVVSLSAGENTCKELITCLGRRQGQSFSGARDDLIECIFSHNANPALIYMYIRKYLRRLVFGGGLLSESGETGSEI
jgi:hypothetical protein